MATRAKKAPCIVPFCKTSLGGFNLDNVTQWTRPRPLTGVVRVWFTAPGDGQDDSSLKQDFCEFEGKQAQRVLEILNGVCIFDATKESK